MSQSFFLIRSGVYWNTWSSDREAWWLLRSQSITAPLLCPEGWRAIYSKIVHFPQPEIFIHSFIHSFVRSFIHSFIHSYIYSFI